MTSAMGGGGVPEGGGGERDLLRDTRKTVFLVDRSDSFIMYLRILLERMGFRVVPLKKAKLLRELLPIVKPDLVLLGTTAEGTDPVEVVKSLKDPASGSPVPVILIAKSDEEDLEFECRKAGFAGCLERPVNIFRLFRVVYDSIVFSSGEKRVNLRSPFREKVSVSHGGGTSLYRATSLSEGGVFIRTRETIPTGVELTVTVPLGFGVPELFRGEVIYNKTTLGDADPTETGAAIRFISPTSEQVSQLTVCILGLLVGDILEDQEEPVLSLVSQTNNLYEDIVLDHIRLGKELKDSQAQLGAIVEKLPVGMVTLRVGAEGGLEVLTSNPAAGVMTDGEDRTGRGQDPLPSLAAMGLLDDFRKVAREGGTFQAGNVQCPGEGDGKYFDILAFQLTHGDVVVMISDVTRRRRMEENALRLQKIESLGFLAGGIAHDFNNLLQMIAGSVELAQFLLGESEESLPPKRKERIQYLLGQGEGGLKKASKLSIQLLTFARGGHPVVRPMELPPVISESVEFALHGSTIRSSVDVSRGLACVKGDRGQLHQVFTNIVINAKQAMPAGGNLVVTAENIAVGPDHVRLAAGDYVLVSVRDTGMGIPADMLARIFDPYFTTKQEGSGLGLSSALSIVHNHGGWVDVESVVGKGTNVRVYLPAAEETPEDGAEHAEGAIWKGTGRVLVVDDEVSLWPVFQDMLEALGFEAVCVRGGDEMLRVYGEDWRSGKPFDAVIVDLTVRGGTGGETAVARLLEIDPGARAIVSSGYADAPELARFREYGFQAALRKPWSAVDLSKALEEILG